MKGVDTLRLPRDWGFDFITAVQCTVPSATYRDCIHHFVFTWGGSGDYRLFVGWYQTGYGMNLGKTNLDSIKTVPADTTMQRLGGYTMDSILPNDLQSRIGNVYVMKTGADPRCNCKFYAKIKILKLIVHDSATHDLDMVFLWACNVDTRNDLTTAGLDTFNLDTLPVSTTPQLSGRRANNTIQSFSHVFSVGTGKLVLPKVWAGKTVTVFDLNGRTLGRVLVGREGEIVLPKGIGKGAAVVVGEE